MATEAPPPEEQAQTIGGVGGEQETGELIPKSPTNETVKAQETVTEDNNHVDDEEKGKEEDDDDDDDVGEKEETAKLLPKGFVMTDLDKDIYSLIFTGDPMGPSFWFGMTVCLFQGVVVWLVFYDLIDWDSKTNPMRIPAGNDFAVSLAQGALMVLMSQDSMDLMEGLEFLIDGYHPEVMELCPHATFAKYILAGTCHTIVGALLAIVIWTLLMQETTVFGLGVDFVAMNKFFAQIDNIAFRIGARGVCSPTVQDEIKKVAKVKVRRSEHYTWSRRVIDMLLLLGVMTGFAVFKAFQSRGDFICDSVYVEVGDVFNPGLGPVSGMFDTLPGLIQHDGRVIYQERVTGKFRLAYCNELKRWTMTPYFNGTEVQKPRWTTTPYSKKLEIFEPCGNDFVEVLAQSGKDDGYDIVATASTWEVKAVRYGLGYNPFTHFSITCNECSSTCKPQNGICNEREVCECHDGHYGLNCEYKDPCPYLMVNIRSGLFPNFVQDGRDYAVPIRYSRLTYEQGDSRTADKSGPIQVEYRPVYYNETKDASFVMLFSGRRWLLFGFPSTDDLSMEDYVWAFSRPNFDMINSQYSPIYASSPMDIGTPSNRATPDGVDWFYVTRKFDGDIGVRGDDDTPVSYRTIWWVEENQPVQTRIQCGICDDDSNPCKNFGICENNTNSVGEEYPLCTCFKEVGSLCEYEQKCTDVNHLNKSQFLGCPFNATCGRDGSCDCPYGYGGKTCQVEALCVNLSPFEEMMPSGECLNNGKCNSNTGYCSCPEPFHGPLCQFSNGESVEPRRGPDFSGIGG